MLLIFTMVSITACRSAPNSSQNEIEPTPIVTISTFTSRLSTAEPMDIDTIPSPAIAQSTREDINDTDSTTTNITEKNIVNIRIGDTVLSTTLVENSSVDALVDALSEGPLTVDMRDYGSMEKVGSLGMDFPRNDEQITTEAGDIILFQGSMLVIYYAPNSWNFTRLGKINNINAKELRDILGDGDVTVTLSLQQE